MFKKYTPTWLMKTAQLSKSVKQLTDNVHLGASVRSIYVVWIDGIPQSIVYLPRSDKFIGFNSFYIHAWHQVIKATRCNKNGVLQNVPWWVGRLLSDVTWASHGSPNQPIRHNQKHWRVFLKIPSQAENWEASNCWRSIFEVLGKSSWSFLNSWRSCSKNRL